MTSSALRQWRTDRAVRVDRLLAAHRTVRGVDRRWITDELNHSLILRLAAEFQGYARTLHDEASQAVVSALAPNDVGRQQFPSRWRQELTTFAGRPRQGMDHVLGQHISTLVGVQPW